MSEPVLLPSAAAQALPCYRGEDPRRVSPALAMVLSLMPGLGHIYLGRTRTGFRNILVVASLIAVLNQGIGALEPLLGFFLSFFWLFTIVDAGRQAQAWNRMLLNPDTAEALPQEEPAGSLLAGVGLIGLGLFTLAHRIFGFSLAWMGRWWPVALVLVGAWLVWKTLERPKATPAES